MERDKAPLKGMQRVTKMALGISVASGPEVTDFCHG